MLNRICLVTAARRPVRPRTRGIRLLLATGAALFGVGCGGGGGSSTGDTQKGVVLIDFLQAAQDNVPLNRTLEFRFSSDIDPNSVNPDSIQVRSGALFGAQVFGKYIIQGSTVFFEPKLPGLCDLSDGGFQPDLDYRVTLVGSPEEFAIRNLSGTPLKATVNALFHTRKLTDPQLFEDQIPGIAPKVTGTSPVDETYPQLGDPTPTPAQIAQRDEVMVRQGNKVVITFSENLNPCTVSETTVLFQQYAVGDVTNGFVPNADATPSTPTTWGSGTATTPARRVRSTFTLKQDQLTTQLTLTPTFGEFPDNALLVVTVTNNVQDFGGNAMVPKTVSFVTENRVRQYGKKSFDFTTDFPINPNLSTGDVNSARSPGKAQGWLLFAGDGDNGANLFTLSGPGNTANPVGCSAPAAQANDANPDDFDPTSDVTLSTGASRNTCRNTTDGSTAVVFEYRTFRIRNGVTVRLVGVNAAIILVSGDVSIEATARLLVRGDNAGGAPNGAGTVGIASNQTTKPAGGVGVAGGGDGGFANNGNGTALIYGQNGTAAIGSVDAYLAPGFGGSVDPIRVGQGRGAVGQTLGATYPSQRIAPGGGGGGHAAAGVTGANNVGGGAANATLMNAFVDGAGGATFGDLTGRMRTPEAGSGGGAGGTQVWYSTTLNGTGGAGGAGGGFVDLTSSANITILGTIDAAGSRGGQGANYSAQQFAYYGGGGGGGGGSGGGIRVLSPKAVTLGATTVLTTAGGVGGTSGYANGYNVQNPGGAGGIGRIAIEDGDSVISGISAATLIPADGASAGFYRGIFDATRFQGGGLQPVVISNVIDMGPTSPTYIVPDQTYSGTPVVVPGTPRVDFAAGIPLIASRGAGKTGMLIEMQGFAANADGTPSSVGTGWKAICYFTDSGAETFPNGPRAVVAAPNGLGLPPPADVPAPSDSAGTGFGGANPIDGKQFAQFRITFFLKNGMGPFDPGPYLDRWDFYYSYDQ